MSTDNLDSLPLGVDSTPSPAPGSTPSTPRQCSSLTRAGKPCGARAVHGEQVCAMHSSRGAEIRAKATQASADARRDKVKDRKEAQEAAKLSLTEAFRLAAGKRQTELVNATLDRAILDKDSAVLRLVWERLEGKVADHLVTEAGDPFTMTEAQLAKWLDTPVTEQGTASEPQ